MEAKDKAEILMKQAEFFASRFDERRKYEWKVALGFWGVLLVATKIGNISIPFWLVIAIVLLYSLVWLRGLWLANDKDKSASFSLWRESQNILLDDTHPLKPIDNPKDSVTYKNAKWWFGFLGSWSVWFHILATCILVYILYSGVSLPPENKPQKVEVSGSIYSIIRSQP